MLFVPEDTVGLVGLILDTFPHTPPSESVVVCDTFNNRLIQYSSGGSLTRVFNSFPALNKPSAAVVFADLPSADGASFAVKDHNDIYVFDLDCNQIRRLVNKKLNRPYGEVLRLVRLG